MANGNVGEHPMMLESVLEYRYTEKNRTRADIESQLVSSTPVQNQNQLKNIAMAFYFTTPLEISLLFAQTNSQLSNSFHLLSFLILLTFLFLFVSNFIAHKYARTAQDLDKIAVLLVATAVVFTITIPFPLILKCVTWALYAISLIVVLTGQYYCLYCT
ncbi:hypothetical protein EZV62_001345 [Acer yangbiense]|uniref:Uncharacterized protein n=1 Tax=Acer yangbiense TaxID=1000413 RepID=A0A5C7IW66_9ROSI|nr:hypothetical protein EZV62_001345 [Acer yangbiense]